MSGPWPIQPGVPAMGHVTANGFWHPGAINRCAKCDTTNGRSRDRNVPDGGRKT